MCSVQKANKLTFLGFHYKSQKTLERVKKFGHVNYISEYLYAAIKNEKFGILQWARENKIEWNDYTICKKAIELGQLTVLKWMDNVNKFFHPWTCKFAAQFGQLEVLQWGMEKGNELSREVCIEAAVHGHLDILKWLKDKNCCWDRYLIHYTKYRHIKDWIRETEVSS